MWQGIGEEIGVTFKVDASLRKLDNNHLTFHPSDTRRIVFTIRRE
jgi:hypothetical protein